MFHGFQTEEFQFRGQTAFLAHPNGPGNGKLALKTEYWDAFPNFEIALLEQGYHLCYVMHRTRWAPEEDIDFIADFVLEVAADHQLDPRCLCVGMSCGGLVACKLAQLRPEVVGLLYLDAPVMNILSLAGLGAKSMTGEFHEELMGALGLTPSSLICYRKSPIDHLEQLLPFPVLLVYGDADDVVPYEENAALLVAYFRANGGKIQVHCKPGCGHHPHGLEDLTPLLDFVEANLK